MAKLLSSLLALIALGVCIWNRVDPLTSVLRASIAFGIGFFIGAFWDSLWLQKKQLEPIYLGASSEESENSDIASDQEEEDTEAAA